MSAAAVKDRVEFHMNGVRFTGVVGSIDQKHRIAVVVFSPGVDVTVPVEDLTVTESPLVTVDEQVEEAVQFMGHS